MQLGSSTQPELIAPLITLNRAYQEVIDEKLQKLRQQLEENLRKQNELLERLNVNRHSSTVAKVSGDIEVNKIRENYFKSIYKDVPPDNEDTVTKRQLVHYDYLPTLKPEWTQKNRTRLKNAVVEDVLRILKTPLLNRLQFLNEKLKKLEIKEDDQKGILEVKLKYKQASYELHAIDKLNEAELLKRIDLSRIDWFKISNKNFDNQWSANECRLVWLNVCSQTVNQTKWTSEESTHLMELARKYREKSWIQVASELGTSRSVYLCMKRYHEKTAVKYCRRDWTGEETEELLELCDRYGVGHYIPFNYLAYIIGTRDRVAVYLWYSRINPLYNHGKWSSDEDRLLMEALNFYSVQFNWSEISDYVGTRSSLQCRERYENKCVKPTKYVNWSIEEDRLLLDLYDTLGAQWSKIAAELPLRTDHSCLTRHQKLMKWKQQWEWFTNQPDEIREFIEFICKTDEDNDIEKFTTSKGEVIPRVPGFMSQPSFIGSIVAKIFENKDMVFEFVRQKRSGMMNFSLLDKIGIRTANVSSKISQYKRIESQKRQQEQQQQQRPMRSKESKAGRKRKIRKTTVRKPRKKKKIEQDVMAVDESPPRLRTLLPKPVSEAEAQVTEECRLALLGDLRPTKNVDKPKKQPKIPKAKKPKPLPKPKAQKPKAQKPKKAVEKAQKERAKMSKIRELLKLTDEDLRVDETKSVEDQPTARRTLPIPVLNEEQASYIVKLDSVPIGTKIYCLQEESNKKFRLLYALQKKENNYQYFEKYVLIRFGERLVGIKREGGIDESMFTREARDRVEQALDAVFNVTIKQPIKRAKMPVKK